MTELASSVTGLAVAFGPSIVVKATVALVLTLAAVRLARHSRASVRHLLLTAGFGVVIALRWPPSSRFLSALKSRRCRLRSSSTSSSRSSSTMWLRRAPWPSDAPPRQLLRDGIF